MKTTGNTIFMTGGTSGIGLELARRFRDLGNTVIISGRRQDLLDQLATEGLDGIALNVADPKSIKAAYEAVVTKYPDVNVLVTMAGIMRTEDLRAPDLDTVEATIDINLLGTIRTVTAFTPHLLQQPDATIITVSSGLAFIPLAVTPTYNATKAAIHSYTQSLRHQLADTAIQVIELVPPAVQTELFNNEAPDPTWMPLDDFADESIHLLQHNPDAEEVLVDRVHFLRAAERENRYPETLAALNGH